MVKISKKNCGSKKAVSWYAALTSNKKRNIKKNGEFREPPTEQNESKSLEVRPNGTCNPTTSQLKGYTRCTAISIETRQILEASLNKKRSETCIYRFNTQLIESVPVGDIAYMSRLLAMGANPNATCRLTRASACHVAAMFNNDALEFLLSSGAGSLRSDLLGRTPLHLAAWEGHTKQIALLLKFPEDLMNSIEDTISPETEEALRKLCIKVHPLMNLPCERRPHSMSTIPDIWIDGMEHNCRHMKEWFPVFMSGWTALHAASARAQYHCVQLLLAAGANVLSLDILGRSPLDVAGSAHYMGHKIDVLNLMKTVRLLLKTGSKFQNPPASHANTPLHAAVEHESEELVEELLQGGACATLLDSKGLTAMHICVKKHSKEILQLLVNYDYSDNGAHLAIVDAKDQTGNSVLGAAINEGWIQGVCIALGAGANITMQGQEGDSALHMAAQLGNIDILQEIITIAKYSCTIDFRNDKGETALFKAISHNQLNALKLLLEAGASIEQEIPLRMNVFHSSAKHGNKDILNYLLEYYSHVTAKMINTVDGEGYTPLVYAVLNNHPACLELLITKGAVVNINVKYYDSIKEHYIWTTPLHIAASDNHCEIARIIIQHDASTIHVVNSEYRQPLHEACRFGNREMITLLLHKGADLSSVVSKDLKSKLAPIDLLMNNVLKPTEFMQEIFDSFITSQGMSVQEPNCEVTVNYDVLVPNKSDLKQMRVIKALANTGNRFDQNRLLLHPLVQSFLHLKWKALLPIFYGILALHMCFVLSLNVYAISVFYFKDKEKSVPIALQSNFWKLFVYLTACLITIQEIISIKIKNKRYLLYLETWVKLLAITFAVILPLVVSYESEWARLIATFALLLSWIEMMFLLSRFPNWGFYILMFGKVAGKVFKVLLSFVFLIFGFSMCFMIQFKATFPFEDPWAAFVKTMVMMTTEYEYQTIISEDVTKEMSESTIIILRIIFTIFLILVSIVLMNLLVGVAVSDVNHLEMLGNIKRLEKQVEFIISLEDIVCHKFIRRLLPRKLFKRWEANYKWKNEIILRPREATCGYDNRLPAYIREAIFEQARLQKKQSDKEFDSMILKKKLNEIHDIMLTKNANESEGTDNCMMKIIEEINEMRNDIEFIKNCVILNRRCTIDSNKSSFL